MIKGCMFIIIIGVVACCGQAKSSLDDRDAKTTIQNLFSYASNEKYDSLKVIFPSEFLQNANDSYLKIYFRDIRKIVNVNGIPDQSQLMIIPSSVNWDEYRATYVPKSAKSLYVDSVQFIFRKSVGFDKVWFMKVFNNDRMFDSIRTH